jgi:hypothetical protein
LTPTRGERSARTEADLLSGTQEIRKRGEGKITMKIMKMDQPGVFWHLSVCSGIETCSFHATTYKLAKVGSKSVVG